MNRLSMRYMLKILILIQILLFYSTNFYAQNSRYSEVYSEVKVMLVENSVNFKRAVFLTENIYFEDKLDESEFYETIRFYASLIKGIVSQGDIEYRKR